MSALPLRREHLSDAVFESLATDILQGTIAPGDAVPPERTLSERFGVSKILVRQAVHRLAESGLVDVRQGGTTRVLDPQHVADVRIFELYYRLAPSSEHARALARDVLEKQFTQGLSLVEVFGRRASTKARADLVALAMQAEAKFDDDGAMHAFEQQFWSRMAEGCGNRVLSAEVRWWYTALRSRPEMPSHERSERSDDPSAGRRSRWMFHAELARRLRDRDGAIAFYLESLVPTIDALFEPPPKPPATKARAHRGSRKGTT